MKHEPITETEWEAPATQTEAAGRGGDELPPTLVDTMLQEPDEPDWEPPEGDEWRPPTEEMNDPTILEGLRRLEKEFRKRLTQVGR